MSADEDFASDVWDSPLEAPTLQEQIAEAMAEWAAADAVHRAAVEENDRLKELGAAASDRQSRAWQVKKAVDERLMALVHQQARTLTRQGELD